MGLEDTFRKEIGFFNKHELGQINTNSIIRKILVISLAKRTFQLYINFKNNVKNEKNKYLLFAMVTNKVEAKKVNKND